MVSVGQGVRDEAGELAEGRASGLAAHQVVVDVLGAEADPV